MRMKKNIARLALLVVTMQTVPQVAVAQSHRDTVLVQAGALRFVRENVQGHGVIAVDTTGHFAAASTARPETLREAATAAELPARLGSGFVTCANPRDHETCTLNGVDAVAELASSYFHADSAYVRLHLTERTDATPRLSGKVYVVRFVKKGAAWVYAGAVLRSQT